jgi:hypothetical protein
VGDPHSSARVCLDNPRGRRFAPTSQASETQLGKEQRQIVAPPSGFGLSVFSSAARFANAEDRSATLEYSDPGFCSRPEPRAATFFSRV